MPPKKAKRPKRRAPAKKGLKQKQKQQQRVNVNVSSGGGGGSGGFIPIPQAPSIDYALLSNLLRPANTVDIPIRAQAPITEGIATRPAETQTLAEGISTRGTQTGNIPSAGFFSETEGEAEVKKVRKGRGPNKPKVYAFAVEPDEVGLGRDEAEYQRQEAKFQAQKSGMGFDE